MKSQIRTQSDRIDDLTTKSQRAESAVTAQTFETLADANAWATGYTNYAFGIIKNVLDVGESFPNATGALCIWKPAPVAEWRRLDNTTAVIS